MPKYSKAFIFTGLVVVAAVVHSLYLSYASFFLDEAFHIWYALRSVSEVLEHGANDPNPPIFNLMEWGWLRLFGISEIAMRSMSVVMLALATGVLYLFAERNFNRTVGIVAALLFLASPIQYRFSHLARPYSLLMLFTVLSYGFLFDMLRKKSGLKMVMYYVCTTLMLFIHPTSIFNLPAQGLIILLSLNKEKMMNVFLTGLTFLAGISFGAYYLSIPYFNKERNMWFGSPNWKDIENVFNEFFGYPFILYGTCLLLFVAVLKDVFQKRWDKKLFWVLSWGVVPIVFSVVVSIYIKPIFQDKYIMTAQVGLMLLVAVLVDKLFNGRVKILLSGAVIVAMFSAIKWKPLPEGDWKNAVAYVTQHYNSNQSILVDPWYEHTTFAYYFNRDAFTSKTSTGDELAKDRAYTGIGQFLNEEGEPRTPILHVLLAHEGFVDVPEGLAEVVKNARLIDSKQFKAVRALTYSFDEEIQVLDSAQLELTTEGDSFEGKACTGFLSEDRVYSCPVQIDIPAQRAGFVQIKSSVKIKAEQNLDNVLLMVTAGRNDTSILYRPIQVNKPENESGWFEVHDVNILTDVNRPCQIGVYLWSQKGEELEIKDLQVVIMN